MIDAYDTPIQEGYSKDFYEEIIGFMRNFSPGHLRIIRTFPTVFLPVSCVSLRKAIFRHALEYYEVTDKEAELKDWYDGYLFGNTEIYNPWSVINYISRGCIPRAYWVNTGKNEVLDAVLKAATDDIIEKLYALLQGEQAIARIDQSVVYRSLSDDPANIYSLLLVAGYLKTPVKELQADGAYLCEVSIPNREIAESLYVNDPKKLQQAIAEYMDKSISYYAPELKSEKELNEEELKALSEEARNQNHEKRYDAEMHSDGVKSILKLGIAFSGKKVIIKI